MSRSSFTSSCSSSTSSTNYVDEIPEEMDDDLLFITVGTLTGAQFPINIFASDTVLDLKDQIEALQGIPSKTQILLFRDKQLSNYSTLAQCNIYSGATLQLLVHMEGGHPPPLKSTGKVTNHLSNHGGDSDSVLYLLCRDKEDFFVLELRVNNPAQLKDLQEKYLSSTQNSTPIPSSLIGKAVPLTEFIANEATPVRPGSADSVESFQSGHSSLSGILSIPSSMVSPISSRSTTPLPLIVPPPRKLSSATVARTTKNNRFRNNRPATTISLTPVRMTPRAPTQPKPISSRTKSKQPSSRSSKILSTSRPTTNQKVGTRPPLPPIPQATHCALCQKKLGLAKTFKCKCGNVYCGVHRYSDRHQCTYNYKEAGKVVLTKENPLVVKPKIEKI